MSNTGHRNTGDWNTGHSNTGHRNTGDWNTGHRNTGHSNTGHRNTGDWNTGHRNTGDWNTGHRNTGDWNTCNFEAGYFNTIESDNIRIFNKDYSRKLWEEVDKPMFLYFYLTEWIRTEDMTDKEKKENTGYMTTCGYLREYEYKEAFKKSWDEADKEDRKKIFNIPNFDADIFFEISGIDVRQKDNTDKINKLVAMQQELINKAEEIQKKIKDLSE